MGKSGKMLPLLFWFQFRIWGIFDGIQNEHMHSLAAGVMLYWTPCKSVIKEQFEEEEASQTDSQC